MSGRSFCKPVIKVDRVPTPLPSEDTPTPSGGRFGNLRAKRESQLDEQPSISRFANLSTTSLVSLVDSPTEESRFSRLRSRPSEGSFPVETEGRDFKFKSKPVEEITEGRVFGTLKASSSCPNMDEVITEPSRFSSSLRTNSYGSAFDMQRDRKPSREETNKRLVVNESSNFILKKIADRQRKEDEPSQTIILRGIRNAFAEIVMIAQAQNTVESPPSQPKKTKAKTKKKNQVSMDDLDDDMPVGNATKIAEQFGQIEVSESDEDEDDTNGMSGKELKKLRRLEKVEARGGAKNHYI
jgi:hypothetical protein